MSRCLVTGSSSDIGIFVVKSLREHGYFIKTAGRRNCDVIFDLSQPLDKSKFGDFEFLIHIAWQRSRNTNHDFKINLEGSRAILAVARERKAVPILISTDSADEPTSFYGCTKRILEDEFIQAGGYVLRCGLIWGGGVSPILSSISKLSKLPLFCFHLYPDPFLRTTSQREIITALERTLATPILVSRVLSVGSSFKFPLSYLSHLIRKRNCLAHIPIPTLFIYWISKFFRTVGVFKSIDPDSFKSFIKSPSTTEHADQNFSEWSDSEEFFSWVIENLI